MNTPDFEIESLVAPWNDQTLLTEQDAIDKLEAAVQEARDGGAKDAARLSIIAVGNYVWMTQDWPQLIERANALLNELDNTLSRRWG